MKDLDKLNLILKLKSLRKRKAQVAYIEAVAKTRQTEARTRMLRDDHQQKLTLANSYAQDRFAKLQSTNEMDTFFTTMTVGLLRRRKEVASFGLRTKRAERDLKLAQTKQDQASSAFARASISEKQLETVHEEIFEEHDHLKEQDAEEGLVDLINMGRRPNDPQ